jgi:hypothetical protein
VSKVNSLPSQLKDAPYDRLLPYLHILDIADTLAYLDSSPATKKKVLWQRPYMPMLQIYFFVTNASEK